MPIVHLSAEGTPLSEINEAGTYHSTALVLSLEAQSKSIKVDIGEVKILKKENKNCIWTPSLQSCFPVIFKFKNGDIGLYHSTGSSIQKVEHLLNDRDLEEIQLFEKGTEQNSSKVKRFIENLLDFYKNTDGILPLINLQIKEDISPYGVAICYKSYNEQPIIIIGESTENNGLANDMELCINRFDLIKRFKFESIIEKQQINPVRHFPIPIQPEPYFQENLQDRGVEKNHFFKNPQERVDLFDADDEKQSSCVCALL